jgi:hypothetical protein
VHSPGLNMIGLMIVWRIVGQIFQPIFAEAVHLLYLSFPGNRLATIFAASKSFEDCGGAHCTPLKELEKCNDVGLFLLGHYRE